MIKRMSLLKELWRHRALLLSVLVPIFLLPIALVDPQPKWQCAYVVALMSCFWILQVFLITVASLLPIVLFPMFGIISSRETAKIYMSDASLVFMGGMVVAAAMEVWGIDKRISLRILLLVGSKPRWLMLGLMLSTWVLSMWISNTATTAMVIPIAQAILSQLSHHEDPEDTLQTHPEELELGRFLNRRSVADKRAHQRMCKGLILSVAYAANIGGMATLTGTATNMALSGQIDLLYSKCGGHSPVTYGRWMASCVPLSFLLLLVAWIWLQIFFLPSPCKKDRYSDAHVETNLKATIRENYDSLGPVTFAQTSVLIMFFLLVGLWVSRDIGGVGGWGLLFPPRFVSDATSALGVALFLFILPSKNPFKSVTSDVGQPTLLSWEQFNSRMSWGMVLLLGGGFSLAKGSEISGLSEWIGGRLESLSHLNPTLLLFIICYMVTAATELTNNVAIIILLLPILSQLMLVTRVNPLYYMLPATLSASLAFMLPAATPPNAIVFSSGYVKIIDMVLAGLVLNILSVPLVVLATETWGKDIFDLDVFPDCFSNETLSDNFSVTV